MRASIHDWRGRNRSSDVPHRACDIGGMLGCEKSRQQPVQRHAGLRKVTPAACSEALCERDGERPGAHVRSRSDVHVVVLLLVDLWILCGAGGVAHMRMVDGVSGNDRDRA